MSPQASMNVFSITSACLVALSTAQDSPAPAAGERLEREVFAQPVEVGEITDMALGRLDGAEHMGLIVVGTHGYAELASDGTVARSGRLEATVPPNFTNTRMNRHLLDMDGDGDLDVMTLARSWVGRTARHRPDGSVAWAHPRGSSWSNSPAVVRTSCGDIDSDGRLEVFMNFNATTEVHLLNADGDLIWSQDWGSRLTGDGVEFLDVDGDGNQDIVYIDGESLCARNGSGELLATTSLPDGGYVNRLEVVEDLGETAEDWLLVGHHVKRGERKGQNYHLVALDAKTVGSRVPWEAVDTHRWALPIEFAAAPRMAYVMIDEVNKQAPIAGIAETWLVMRILDKGRSSIYEETIKPPTLKTAPDHASVFIAATESQPARLLLAYGGTVWAYTPSPDQPLGR